MRMWSMDGGVGQCSYHKAQKCMDNGLLVCVVHVLDNYFIEDNFLK